MQRQTEDAPLKLLLFSDLHRDLGAARSIAERATGVDGVLGAGDFAVKREGLAEVIEALRVIQRPTILVPGNGESDEELRRACEGWAEAHVLHGEATTIDGVPFFGIGAAIPRTPFGPWSFDLDENQAEDLLRGCPSGSVLVSHSPPLGHADRDAAGRHMGSRSVLETVQRTGPRLVVCGHIHAAWGQRSTVGGTPVVNAGPGGLVVDVEGPP